VYLLIPRFNGMIPELVGRLPVIAALNEMTREVLVRILTEPKNALVRQYGYFFQMEGAEFEFTDSALSVIAERALSRKTGARALRSVIEEIMLPLMYDLPDMNNEGVKYVLSRESIEQGQSLTQMQSMKKESA